MTPDRATGPAAPTTQTRARSLIIASAPIHGHVMPLLAIAKRFVARGDRVRFITGARFADAVTATGAVHLPLPAEADFDDRQDWDKLFPERAALRGVAIVSFDAANIFIRPGQAQYDAIMAALADEPADAVLAEPALAGAALLLGLPRRERPPVIVCGGIPLTIASRDTAPFGMGLRPLPGPIGRARNAVLSAVVARTILPQAERAGSAMHQQIHGVPLPFPIMDWPRHADALVQLTVPEFEYPRSDAPATLHFAGPIPADPSHQPLPPWWAELDGSRPLVHLTQGTIANRDHRQVFGPALEALADQDVLVVVATGGRPVTELPPLPRNARAAAYLPYDLLLPKTDVFVTNGGYGGVQLALRHGVPIVATGGQEDKPEVGARVAWSGVGIRLRSATPTPRAMGRAVRSVLTDPRYRQAARHLSARMAAAPGFAQLARLVDDLAERRTTT